MVEADRVEGDAPLFAMPLPSDSHDGTKPPPLCRNHEGRQERRLYPAAQDHRFGNTVVGWRSTAHPGWLKLQVPVPTMHEPNRNEGGSQH
jgi:hypothetical protein